MNRNRNFLEMFIDGLYFVACVIVFIVALILGYMKILETVNTDHVLLFIGFFFLDEIVITLMWIGGSLLLDLYFSKKNAATPDYTSIYEDDDDLSDDEKIKRDFWIYQEEKNKDNQ